MNREPPVITAGTTAGTTADTTADTMMSPKSPILSSPILSSPILSSPILRILSPLVLLVLSAPALLANGNLTAAGGGEPSPEAFLHVPGEDRPWCYYWWLKGNVDEEQITRDLEAMRAMGFGGLLLFDSRGYHEDAENHIPVPLPIKHEFMSDSWQAMVLHLLREADRLGLKVSINLSDTGGHLRGPWDFGADGPRQLLWSEGNLNGPKTLEIPLPKPDRPYYRDAALVAVRIDYPASPRREQIVLGEKWEPVVPTAADAVRVLETIDISGFVQDGVLRWELPEGTWKILRFGSEVIGDFGSVDILSERVIANYFDKMAGTLLRLAGPLAGKTLTHFYNVSWEGSMPNWTDGFAEYFAEKRGYSMADYWGALRGLRVGEKNQTEQFLTDFYRTVSDAFFEHCYQTIGRLCHENGVEWHSENGGPWNDRNAPMFCQGDMFRFWGDNDTAQGEFWMMAPDQTNICFAANASRIAGKNLTAVEAFTHMLRHWVFAPVTIKPSADWALIDGANWFLWHTFTASVDEAGKPGYEYFAGTHINRNVTWAPMAGGFVDYLARCQYLLRRGNPVSDICVYSSDRNWSNWGRSLPWGKNGLSCPEGIGCDQLTTEALVDRLGWNGQRYELRGTAMSYRLLVLDPEEESIDCSALEKIIELAKSGAPVLLGKRRPCCPRGIVPGGEDRAATAASALWDAPAEEYPSLFRCPAEGDPNEIWPTVLSRIGLVRDFQGEGEVCHRTCGDDGTCGNDGTCGDDGTYGGIYSDIYFVTGTGHLTMLLRAVGTVELWNPVDGSIRTAPDTEQLADGRTRVGLDLPENGSIFVLFRRGAGGNAPPPETIAGQKLPLEGTWQVRFDPAWGGPESVTFDRLIPWNEHPDEGIHFYSGTAVYTKSFELTAAEAAAPVALSLGAVGSVAKVCLNGEEAGQLWTAPWSIDLTGKVKSGTNRLEIEVTNVWANRLIGDAGLPPEKRLTKTNVQYYAPGERHRTHQGFSPDEPLIPSGLIGPVTLTVKP